MFIGGLSPACDPSLLSDKEAGPVGSHMCDVSHLAAATALTSLTGTPWHVKFNFVVGQIPATLEESDARDARPWAQGSDLISPHAVFPTTASLSI